MTQTSNHSWYQQRERKSFIYLESVILEQGWKLRDLSQDNDIDGEIEVFEPVNSDNQIHHYTTAKFIKVQLKAEDKCEIKNDYVLYNKCPVKFLHFCDICDIPIILFLYEANSKTAYWLWIQNYIYNELDVNNAKWRKNDNTVTLKLPIRNLIDEKQDLNCFFDNLKEIAHKGIDEILQLRKSKTYLNYCNVVAQKDMSHGNLRRIEVKVLIENSFANSQDAMKVIIPKINQDFINSDYYGSDSSQSIFFNKKSDIIWLFFYNDPSQIDSGRPFCRTEWISDRDKIKPVILGNNNDILLNSSIALKWDKELISSNFIKENRITKGKYFDFSTKLYSDFCRLNNEIQKINESWKNNHISFESLKQKITNLSSRLDKLNFEILSMDYFPPYECEEMNQKLVELVSLLHNIAVIFNDKRRDELNLKYLMNKYLTAINKKKPLYEYEREKAK